MFLGKETPEFSDKIKAGEFRLNRDSANRALVTVL